MASPDVIRVMIVDDHDMVRKGLEAMLKGDEQFELVASLSRGEQIIAQCELCQPDVILTDMIMPGVNGVEVVRAVSRYSERIKVILLTNYDQPDLVQSALEAGAVGYLLKNVGITDLANAIRSAYHGRTVLSPEATQALIRVVTTPETAGFNLTRREREVLRLMVNGLNNREIAEQLAISQHTAKNHVSSLLGKLGASTRTEAAIMALELNLVQEPSRPTLNS